MMKRLIFSDNLDQQLYNANIKLSNEKTTVKIYRLFSVDKIKIKFGNILIHFDVDMNVNRQM